MDVEAVEMQLDRIIEKRAVEARDSARVSELWASSVRVNHARQQETNRLAWCSYHLDQAARLEATAAELARDHRARAEALLVAGAP